MSLTLQSIGVACFLAGLTISLFHDELPFARKMRKAAIVSAFFLAGGILCAISFAY